MNLIIVESPTKAKTLSKFLGKGYEVEATMGHVMDLPKSPISVDIENDFKPDYKLVERSLSALKKIKKAAGRASVVFLATDPDREGEAIAAHVKEQIGDGKTKRIEFHEITKEAVEAAMGSPRDVNKNLVNAQTARRVLDRVVGYKVSPILWKKIRRGLSAGRVQTVALRLIVEKEKEIEAFVPQEYWETGAKLRKQNKKDEVFVSLFKIGDKKAEVKNGKQAKKIVADLKEADYEVFDVVRRETKKRPYAPFTTSTLTQAAARGYGWSAKKTMSVAQKLYEEGLITYHRTDSMSISMTALEETRSFINKQYGATYLPGKPRFYKTKTKSAQEAHEAVRPTSVSRVGGEEFIKGRFAADANKLYGLIWRRFVSCQMSDAIFDNTRVDVKAGEYLLRASGQVTKFDGWRKVYGVSGNGEVDLPRMEKGEKLELLDVLSDQKFTQPPARFNEASLIKTLEKLGIGRPSTYAPIISTIIMRQYVDKDEGKFKPTPVGVAVSDFLVENFPDTFDYEFTANMEHRLDCVARGECEWVSMMKGFWGPFEKRLVEVEKKAGRVKIETEKLGKKCPDCSEGELVIRTGRFGKFISCSRFPECDYTDKYEDRIGMKCPDCRKGNVIIKKTRKGRKFFGCSRYPKCEYASWTDPSKKKEEKSEDKI